MLAHECRGTKVVAGLQELENGKVLAERLRDPAGPRERDVLKKAAQPVLPHDRSMDKLVAGPRRHARVEASVELERSIRRRQKLVGTRGCKRQAVSVDEGLRFGPVEAEAGLEDASRLQDAAEAIAVAVRAARVQRRGDTSA